MSGHSIRFGEEIRTLVIQIRTLSGAQKGDILCKDFSNSLKIF